jgi:hypothetical protein
MVSYLAFVGFSSHLASSGSHLGWVVGGVDGVVYGPSRVLPPRPLYVRRRYHLRSHSHSRFQCPPHSLSVVSIRVLALSLFALAGGALQARDVYPAVSWAGCVHHPHHPHRPRRLKTAGASYKRL